MRDKNRIPEFTKELERIWMQCYPDWRFGQILFNAQFIIRKKDSLDIQDPFYEESTETWGRIKSIINIPEEGEGE